jgi:hypothetical protein
MIQVMIKSTRQQIIASSAHRSSNTAVVEELSDDDATPAQTPSAGSPPMLMSPPNTSNFNLNPNVPELGNGPGPRKSGTWRNLRARICPSRRTCERFRYLLASSDIDRGLKELSTRMSYIFVMSIEEGQERNRWTSIYFHFIPSLASFLRCFMTKISPSTRNPQFQLKEALTT